MKMEQQLLVSRSEKCGSGDEAQRDQNHNIINKDPRLSSVPHCPIQVDAIIHGGGHCGDYRVKEKLGYGNFSTVWLCRDRKKDVAVKVIRGGKSYADADPAKWEVRVHHLIQEVGHKAKNDPHLKRLVKMSFDFAIILDVGLGLGPVTHQCLVLESLGRSVVGQMFSLVAVKRITRQVLEGLEFLHVKCHLMHADIKPENVLLCPGSPTDNDDNVDVKLIDFGSALNINHCSFKKFEHTIQTRAYRSPEVIIGASFSCTVDIWSVGCLAYELATQSYLFNPGDHSSTIAEYDALHLALMVEVLGPFPISVALNGEFSVELFNTEGELRYLESNKQEKWDLSKRLIRAGWTKKEAAEFGEFLKQLLQVDPVRRPTAAVCLDSSWLKYPTQLTLL